MIFMWFFARSSRGTGPKMRVPIGSDDLFTITAAFLSKRMVEPSLRAMSLAVRTTTARRHVALLHPAARNGFLHGHDDDVADAGVAATRTAQHLDAHDPAGARIVGDVQVSLHLNHGSDFLIYAADVEAPLGRTSQVFSLDLGAHSMIRMCSPAL